jgi:tetratricopeptide (TPR) repeat protein
VRGASFAAAPAKITVPRAAGAPEALDPIEDSLKRSVLGQTYSRPSEQMQVGVTQEVRVNLGLTLGDLVRRYRRWLACAVIIPLVAWGVVSVERSRHIRNAITEGDSYYAKGAFEKALRAYQNSLDGNPENSALQEKVNQARDSIMARRNNQIDGLIRQGDSHCANGEYDKGISEYQKGLTLDPENPVLLQKIQRARDAANGALEKQERDAAARTLESQVGGLINEANSYYASGRYDQAIAEYQKAQRLDPDDSLLLGNILQGKIQRARQKQIGALIKRGDSYYDNGSYDQAIDQYNRALDLDPNNQALVKKKQGATSAREWERVHGPLKPDSPAAQPKN